MNRSIKKQGMIGLMALAFSAILLPYGVLGETSYVWTGAGDGVRFSDGQNWEDGNPPQSDGAISILPEKGKKYENDLTDLSPRSLNFIDGGETAYVVNFTLGGNPVKTVSGSPFSIVYGRRYGSFFMDCGLVGDGNISITSGGAEVSSSLFLQKVADKPLQFAGKWILDYSQLHTQDIFTEIGKETPDQVIPDVFTLKHGSSLRNFKEEVRIPAWQGIVLGEGGGGFCGGWKNANVTGFYVDGPVSGGGDLLIGGGTIPVFLNNPNNTYKGKTVVSSPGNLAGILLNEEQEGVLVVGADGAIPKGNDVTVVGTNRGVLELNGHSLELGTLELTFGGILRNSSETPVTVKVDRFLCGGSIEGPVTVDYREIVLLDTPDRNVWRQGDTFPVRAGETLAVTNMGLGGAAVKLAGGTLSLSFFPGLAESAYSGMKVGNDEKRITARSPNGAEMGRKEKESLWSMNSGYYYQGYWYLSESGSYNFGKKFDNGAALEIDRERILENTVHNAESQVQGVPLAKGWHEVRLWFANQGGYGGPYEWSDGLKWSFGENPVSANEGKGFTADSATFVFYPNLVRPVYVGAGGGNIVRERSGEEYPGELPDLLLFGGVIECGDNTNHDPLQVDGSVTIGSRSGTIPVFDANLSLPEGASLTFRDRVWIRRVPNCDYRILPGTEVFLSRDTIQIKDKVLESGARICWASFNLGEWTPEETIKVGTEAFLKFSQSWSGDLPLLDDGQMVCPNSFDIAEGATLHLKGLNYASFTGRFTGGGRFLVTDMARHSFVPVGDFSAFTGTIECDTDVGMNIQIENPVQFGPGTLIVRGECLLYLGKEGESVEPGTTIHRAIQWGGGRFYLNLPEIRVESLTVLPDTNFYLAGTGRSMVIKGTGFHSPLQMDLSGEGHLVVEVDEGESYRVPDLSGRGHLDFKGSGTLEVGALFDTFSGTLTFSDTLRIVPSTQCAANPVLWLDASKPDSFELDGEGGIWTWLDRREQAGTRPETRSYPYAWLNQNVPNDNASGFKTALPPTLLSDGSLRPGTVVDFGASNSGQWLSLSKRVPVATIFLLVGSQKGGGISFYGDSQDTNNLAIIRGGSVNGPIPIKNSIYNSVGNQIEAFRKPYTRVDGVAVDPSKTSLSGDYQIITTCLDIDKFPGLGLDTLVKDAREGKFTNDKLRSGGSRFAELLVFDRKLTDEEIQTTERYLYQKWFGRTPVSGNRLTGTAPFPITGGMRIDVSENQEFVLGEITGKGTLSKEGSGTISVGKSTTFEGNLALNGGTLIHGLSLPEPALWMDMTRNDSYGVDAVGKFFWRDIRWDGTGFYPTASQFDGALAPTLLENALNGLPVLDFGELSKIHDRGMKWDREFNIYGAFMVIGSQNSGGTILDGYNRGKFSKTEHPIYGPDTSQFIREGITRLDARDVDGMKTGFSGGYQVLTSCPTRPLTVRGFACDRWGNNATKTRDGGQRLGEVLLFTNRLDSMQILAVEQYLMKKWIRGEQTCFNNAGDLPKVDLTSAADPLTFVKEGNGTVGQLVGSQNVVKTGSGELQIGDGSLYSGTVSVARGDLALDTRASAALRKARFWVDASKAGSLTLSEDGTEVLRWEDCRGHGMYARRDLEPESTVNGITYPNLNPLLVKDGLNGLPVVDFGAWKGNRFLVWEGALTKIRTVFWVVGSQEGGGNLLGSSRGTNSRDFLRKSRSEDTNYDTLPASNPLWADNIPNPCREILNGKSRINGADVDGTTTGLSGQYDIVSLRTTGNVEASAFNMDRDRWNRNATGGQRLAEVIIFDIPLSDEEIGSIEAYLSKKWGLPLVNPWAELWESAVSVMLTPGTKLALGAYGDFKIRGVGGIGEVSGEADLTVRELAQRSAERPDDALRVAGSLTLLEGTEWSADISDGVLAPLLVTGKCIMPGTGVLTLTGCEQIGRDPLLLLKAGTLDAQSLEGWRVESDDPKRAFTIEREGEALYLVARDKGMVLILE